jgi:septum formation protein
LIAPATGARPLVLASTSPYRRELIGRLGLSVELWAPDYDEDAVRRARPDLPPEALVAELARGKARSLQGRFPAALIIGADQMAVLDGDILGKPGSMPAAVAQLERLAGREHRLLTALCILDARTGTLQEMLDVHHLLMRPLTRRQLESYVTRDRPVDCAGSYRVESLGMALFEHVRGDDYTAVIGLPLTGLSRLLASSGVEVL